MAKTQAKERGPELFEGVPDQNKPDDAKKPNLPAAKQKGTAVAKVERQKVLADEASDEVATLLRVIADPACDVAKAERIEAMIARARAKVAENKYNAAFIELQADLPEITKDGLIDQGETRSGRQGSKSAYATYPNIQKAVRGPLHQHKFTLKHTVRPGPGNVGVVIYSTLSHAGHTEVAELPLPLETSGSKNNVQGVNSSISYGKRINTTTLLDLISRATEDADRDGHRPPKQRADADEKPQTITGPQAKALLQKIDECGVPSDMIQKKFKALGITRIHDLPASSHDDFVKSCENYKAEAARRAKQ